MTAPRVSPQIKLCIYLLCTVPVLAALIALSWQKYGSAITNQVILSTVMADENPWDRSVGRAEEADAHMLPLGPVLAMALQGCVRHGNGRSEHRDQQMPCEVGREPTRSHGSDETAGEERSPHKEPRNHHVAPND